MRPPTRPSSTTSRPGSPVTVWSAGHHARDVRRSRRRRRARPGRRRRTASRSGSITAPLPVGVLGHQAEARRGLAPHLLEVGPDRLDPLVVQPVDAPGAARLLGDEPGPLEQAQVPGDRRPADRQRVGDLAHRAVARSQQLDDRPAVRSRPAPRTDPVGRVRPPDSTRCFRPGGEAVERRLEVRHRPPDHVRAAGRCTPRASGRGCRRRPGVSVYVRTPAEEPQRHARR